MTIRDALKSNDFIRSTYDRMRRTMKRSMRQAQKIDYVCTGDGISLIKNKVSGASAFFPYMQRTHFNNIQLYILWNGFHKHMTEKYLDGDFQIREGDTVIDCGGFVGGFSIAAGKMGAARSVYVEPTPLSRRCAELNFILHDFRTVSVHACALGETSGTAQLNLSLSMADNSLIEPDEGATHESITVDIMTVDQIAEIEALDPETTFVKIEAEGFELEIVKGMKTFRPRIIVVDVTPERFGESPRDEVQANLAEHGYSKFHHTARCLFAKL